MAPKITFCPALLWPAMAFSLNLKFANLPCHRSSQCRATSTMSILQYFHSLREHKYSTGICQQQSDCRMTRWNTGRPDTSRIQPGSMVRATDSLADFETLLASDQASVCDLIQPIICVNQLLLVAAVESTSVRQGGKVSQQTSWLSPRALAQGNHCAEN